MAAPLLGAAAMGDPRLLLAEAHVPEITSSEGGILGSGVGGLGLAGDVYSLGLAVSLRGRELVWVPYTRFSP